MAGELHFPSLFSSPSSSICLKFILAPTSEPQSPCQAISQNQLCLTLAASFPMPVTCYPHLLELAPIIPCFVVEITLHQHLLLHPPDAKHKSTALAVTTSQQLGSAILQWTTTLQINIRALEETRCSKCTLCGFPATQVFLSSEKNSRQSLSSFPAPPLSSQADSNAPLSTHGLPTTGLSPTSPCLHQESHIRMSNLTLPL